MRNRIFQARVSGHYRVGPIITRHLVSESPENTTTGSLFHTAESSDVPEIQQGIIFCAVGPTHQRSKPVFQLQVFGERDLFTKIPKSFLPLLLRYFLR